MRRQYNTGQSTGVGRSFLSGTGASKTQNMYGMLGERNPRSVAAPANVMVQTSSDDDGGGYSSVDAYDVDDRLGRGGKRKKKTKRKKRKKKKSRRKNKRKKKTKRRRRKRKKTRRRR